jgi:hypothetical protein
MCPIHSVAEYSMGDFHLSMHPDEPATGTHTQVRQARPHFTSELKWCIIFADSIPFVLL